MSSPSPGGIQQESIEFFKGLLLLEKLNLRYQ